MAAWIRPVRGSRRPAAPSSGPRSGRRPRSLKSSRSAKARSKSAASKSGSGVNRSRRSGSLDRYAGSVWALIPTFLVALAIRLIHLDQMRRYEDFQTSILDEAWSWDLAARFAAGFGSVGRPFDADPGAALILSALVQVVGSRPDLVAIGLTVIGSIAAVLIQVLGVRVLGGVGGLFCGLLAATYRPAVHHGAHVLDAAFVPCVASLALILIAIQAESKRPLPELAAGLFAGAVTAALALFQGPLLVLAPVMLVVLIFDRKMKLPQKLRRALSFGVGALGVMALASWAFGHVVPPVFGREFHLANRAENRAGDRLPPIWAPADPAGLAAAYRTEGARLGATSGPEDGEALDRSARDVDIDRAWFDRSGRDAAANPWGFLHGWGWRGWRLLNATEAPGPLDMAWESGRSWILRLPFPGWAILLPLALVGVAAVRGSKQDTALILLVVWGAVVLVAAWPFCVTSRARMAIEPALIVLAVRGAMRLFGQFAKRDGPAIVRTAVLVGVAAILEDIESGVGG